MTLEEKKQDADRFLTEQLQKLDAGQKEKLSYVLLGATMASSLIGKAQPVNQPPAKIGG